MSIMEIITRILTKEIVKNKSKNETYLHYVEFRYSFDEILYEVDSNGIDWNFELGSLLNSNNLLISNQNNGGR